MEDCEVCKQGKCQHGEKCCRCNDYDYIIACSYCSQIFELREPTNPEIISSMQASMKHAELLRSSPRQIKRASQKVPPLEIPQLSPEFVFFWSQNSPTSPVMTQRRPFSSDRSDNKSSDRKSSESKNNSASDSDAEMDSE